jgi:hypothetical protein
MNTQIIILAKLNRDRDVWEVFNIQGELFGNLIQLIR